MSPIFCLSVAASVFLCASAAAFPETLIGACCFDVGVCVDNVAPDDCASIHGSFLGEGLTCTGDPDEDMVFGCDDGCPLDPDKMQPGICGCGVSDVDSDADGVPDCIDECPDTLPSDTVNEVGCPDRGACCFDVNVCLDDVAGVDCALIGGVYQGQGVTCEEPCRFPGSGDVNGDGRVDDIDSAWLSQCMYGPLEPPPYSSCLELDLDGEGTVALSDVALFATVFGTCFPNIDADGDGFGACDDNCPYVANPDQADDDGDGVGNVCDNCPDTPANTTVDANGCEVVNPDTDGDGVPDAIDLCPNTPPHTPVDSDGCTNTDVDGDGVDNAVDNCPSVPNPDQRDTDNDGIGDACDPCPNDSTNDPDGDGLCGSACPDPYHARCSANCFVTVDCCPNDPENDADFDGICGDVDPCPYDATPDLDHDGVCHNEDNCPYVANPGQEDTDGDGVGDACDNCPNDANPDQADSNDDGIGNACAVDSDGDGVDDQLDNCVNTPNTDQTNNDADSLGDACDNCDFVTNQDQADADRDGIGDVCDVCPNDPNNDADNDGVCGDVDQCPGTPPEDIGNVNAYGCGPSQLDSDGDGVVDANDHCPNTPAGTTVDATGCPVTTPVCGNGTVETGEQCEPPNTATCDANCQTIVPAVCGDGVIEDGEQCDPPGTDGCDNNCMLPTSFSADACADATPISGEGLFGFDNTAATLDGPGHAACVAPANQDNYEDNMAADVWACWTAPCDGTVFADTCGRTTVDTKIAVYDGCDCPVTDATVLACNDDGCDLESRVTFDVVAGHEYLIRVGTFVNADPGLGAISLSCGLDVCGSSTDSCDTAHDGSGCSDATCCETVCALDSYCCDSANGGWDDTCVSEAGGFCSANGFAVCGVTRNGLCTDPAGTGTPGCADSGCCNTVCAIDTYCCVHEWDDVCATEAAQFCRSTCGDGAGDCLTAHDTSGCNVSDCCANVCIRDPFCCGAPDNGLIGTWDDTCVREAQVLCAP